MDLYLFATESSRTVTACLGFFPSPSDRVGEGRPTTAKDQRSCYPRRPDSSPAAIGQMPQQTIQGQNVAKVP